jgi:hydroxyacylglutathione hydrolase
MLLKRLYDDKLAQASYLVACQRIGAGVIVDPVRDPERYLAAAAAEKITITHVTETHIHADFVSGAHDLAEATGARLYLSGMGGDDWSYARARDWNAELLTSGSSFDVGDVRIDVIHTPGHTPEHITLMVTDTAAADAPMGALTGDFIFVGDVGRPDLLERAAGVTGTMEGAARQLFRSLQQFKKLPDYLQLWPGHGAGSACGKALGAMPQTTLGYERLFNWGLVETDEEAFVRRALEGQPDPPAYFAIMKAINRDGAPPRGAAAPPEISASDLAEQLRLGATVVDTRLADDFEARHAEQTISIPYTKSFLKWAGSLLPYDRDIFLIVAEGERGTRETGGTERGGGFEDLASREIADDLALIGLERIAGVYTLRSFDDLEAAGAGTQSTPQMTIEMLANRGLRDGIVLVDVRGLDEWELGHIPDALHIPLQSLQSRLSELRRSSEIAVHCQAGTRSAIAASILERSGMIASNLVGGFSAWEQSGGEVERSGRTRR